MRRCSLHIKTFAACFPAPVSVSCDLGSRSCCRSSGSLTACTYAAQVAASPEASYVSAEDVSQEFVDKETAIEMEKEDILSKPEAIR